MAKTELDVPSRYTAGIWTAFFNDNIIDSDSLDDAIARLIELNHYWLPRTAIDCYRCTRNSSSAAQKVMSRLADAALHLTSPVEVAMSSLQTD
jgi:hypothetical protein